MLYLLVSVYDKGYNSDTAKWKKTKYGSGAEVGWVRGISQIIQPSSGLPSSLQVDLFTDQEALQTCCLGGFALKFHYVVCRHGRFNPWPLVSEFHLQRVSPLRRWEWG